MTRHNSIEMDVYDADEGNLTMIIYSYCPFLLGDFLVLFGFIVLILGQSAILVRKNVSFLA